MSAKRTRAAARGLRALATKVTKPITRRAIAAVVAVAGCAVTAIGIGLIYLPAALIAGGIAIAAFGFLAIDVEAESR